MKYICTQRCQFNGIVAKGTIMDLTDLEYAIPHVRASFRPIPSDPPRNHAAGHTEPDGQPPVATGAQDAAPPAAKGAAADPLLGQTGSPLPPNAQMTDDELKRRLDSMGVRYAATTRRHELFALLQDALTPHTGTSTKK